MGLTELFIIAIGLSMDAFAVSICKGLSVCKVRPKNSLAVALWFGGFQALMPVLGYFLGVSFADVVSAVDHWIAFVLLGIIGGNMLKESFEKDESCEVDPDFSFRPMFAMAVATSIDALAVGVSFAFLNVNIWTAVLLIGLTTGVTKTLLDGTKVVIIFYMCKEKKKIFQNNAAADTPQGASAILLAK